jgi:hypothetical protein
MKRIGRLAFLFLAAALAAGAAPADKPDEILLQQAKLLILDKDWSAAQARLEELMAKHPESALLSQAQYYKAECLSEQKGKEWEALNAYQAYLRLPRKNAGFIEESEGSIIELAFRLHQAGDRSAIREIENRLDHENKVIRYYAAFKLSGVSDKAIAARAVPVLRGIAERETDAELRDRARIALMRVAPEELRGIGGESPRGAWVLKIRVWEKGEKEASLSINLPWSLASLALQSIPDQEKRAIKSKGYDLNRILDDLVRSKESLLEIASDDSIVKIWIEK